MRTDIASHWLDRHRRAAEIILWTSMFALSMVLARFLVSHSEAAAGLVFVVALLASGTGVVCAIAGDYLILRKRDYLILDWEDDDWTADSAPHRS